MHELSAGIRDLHAQVERLDELLRDTRASKDYSEKLGAAAALKAHQAQEDAKAAHLLLRRVMTIVAAGLLLWTPVVAYGAIWFHELVRNQCYPGVTLTAWPAPDEEPWFCSLFPGTDRHPH